MDAGVGGNAVAVAFDIGTTTVVGASVDTDTGDVVGISSRQNPQGVWGADLISRVKASVEDPKALREMTSSVVRVCNDIIDELTGGEPGRVSEVAAAGNSVMEHILLGISPEPFSRVPYRPVFTEARALDASELGIKAASGARAYVFPIIGGFVGGDTVAVILSLGLHESIRPTLAIDIGTNSEIVLAAAGTVYATSAAAGPAFEGGEVSSGMTATRGAISGVRIDGDFVSVDVVGDVAPRGMCGSGLLDAVSELIRAGVIDPHGRIRSRDEITTNLSVRIVEGGAGNSFVLSRGACGAVLLTQADVRALQTAKAAIRAGVSVLLKKAGVDPGEIDRVYMAGAFGSNIKKESLAGIGVLDDEWLPVTSFAGDAALEGVVEALWSGGKKAEAEGIARKVKYLSLSGSAHFEREFLKSMNF